ncbi:hypothetical protein ACTXT7_015442 [Hymenolepis weldensis]
MRDRFLIRFKHPNRTLFLTKYLNYISFELSNPALRERYPRFSQFRFELEDRTADTTITNEMKRHAVIVRGGELNRCGQKRVKRIVECVEKTLKESEAHPEEEEEEEEEECVLRCSIFLRRTKCRPG